MEILYRQPNADTEKDNMSGMGIECLYLKHIVIDRDRSHITKKRHHHSEYEIHIVTSGAQVYEIDGKTVEVSSGNYLFISPYTSHALVSSAPNTKKNALTFRLSSKELHLPQKYYLGNTPAALTSSMAVIFEEKSKKRPFYHEIIANRTLENLLLILRDIGAENTTTKTHTNTQDSRYLMARQYIDDNVRSPLTVPEVADYCCISPKQLTRIFLREEGIHVSEYIRRARCKQIEQLLSIPALSLRAISEEMGFANEYYFNSYFKKYSGMTPGSYRRTMK